MARVETLENAQAAPRSALAPFKFPVFRGVWIASTVSNLGGLIQSVGASWMMTSIAQSADMVALVQASVALPIMLLALIAGAIADNMDRRRVMLGAQIFLFCVSVALSICTFAGWMTPWLLLLFTFLIGCGTAFHSPAWQASVGDMVPRTHLAEAVALNSMGFNIARSVGPAIGGAIVAAAGAGVAFAVNAMSYVALVSVLAKWRPAVAPRLLPPESLGIAIGAGIRYVLMSPAIRRVMLRSAVFGIGASSAMALMPLVAKHLVAGGPLIYGVLLGSFGLGAIMGALSSARLRVRLSTEALVSAASVAFALAVALVGWSSHLLLTLPALFVTGAMWVLALSTFNVAVQLAAPRWVVARALALYQMAAFGGMAGGSWLWGVLADASGITVSLAIAALVLLSTAALGWWLPLVQTAELNLDPLRTWTAPQTAISVDSRTGPVVVTIEYRIREEDILEFLAAMAERRRIRRRDGARDWKLLRDLADPQLWIERYATPTWLDYLRLNNRLTQNDALIPERLRSLHCGDSPPVVRRMIERQTGSAPLHAPAVHEISPLNDSQRM
jgi:MFS family permease